MKEYRAFVLDEGICWFSKEEISIYKRYGLLEEMKYYLFSSPPKLRGYPLRVCELLKKIENASFYPKLSGLIEAVSEIGGKLYLVGGSVRDLILYGDILREPDLLVDADVSIFLESLLKRGISLKEMTPFLTLKVIVEDELFDVAFCRKEFYERPGDLPKVSIASLMEDMYRRDFTINAMALGICGEEKGMLYDPFFGLEDLSKGLLRVIRPYSFIEDPTRIVRAVRLKMRFSLEFEDETLRLLRKAVEKGALRLISWVRLWREFEEFFKEENAIEGIFLMDNLGIFESIGLTLEEKEREVLMKLRQESLLPEEKERYMLYALFGMKGEDEAREWGLRFQLSKNIRESLVMASFWRDLDRLNFGRKYQIMKKADESLVRFWSICIGRDLTDLWKKIVSERPILSQEEIKKMALNKGVEYGRIKMEVLRLQIEEGLKSKGDILRRLGKESV